VAAVLREGATAVASAALAAARGAAAKLVALVVAWRVGSTEGGAAAEGATVAEERATEATAEGREVRDWGCSEGGMEGRARDCMGLVEVAVTEMEERVEAVLVGCWAGKWAEAKGAADSDLEALGAVLAGDSVAASARSQVGTAVGTVERAVRAEATESEEGAAVAARALVVAAAADEEAAHMAVVGWEAAARGGADSVVAATGLAYGGMVVAEATASAEKGGEVAAERAREVKERGAAAFQFVIGATRGRVRRFALGFVNTPPRRV